MKKNKSSSFGSMKSFGDMFIKKHHKKRMSRR